MPEDKGWEILNSVDNDGGSGTYMGADGSIMTMFSDGSVQYTGADGSYGYKGSDGSGYYSGADGSFGNFSSDGSGQYSRADGRFEYRRSHSNDSYIKDDGSIVTRFSDGSAQYQGADGSFGYKNADGSGYYSGADGSFGNRSAREKKEPNDKDIKNHKDTYGYSDYSAAYTVSETIQAIRTQNANRKSHPIKDIISTIVSVVAVPLTIVIIIFGLCYLASRIAGSTKNTGKQEDHPGEIKLEYSASHYIGENFYDTIIELRNQGFSDIRITPLSDLKAGIFSKDGSIETIEIGGLSDFQSDTWVSEKSVVNISYHSFAKKEKNGFNTEKNNHLIIYGIDIQLPSYLIEDYHNDKQASYHVKNDEETQLFIFNSEDQVKNELEKFGTFFTVDSREYSLSDIVRTESDIIGKKNDEVYAVYITDLEIKDIDLYIVLISANNNKTDYLSDYNDILSGIYVPKDAEICIDFNLKDFKGKKYEDTVAELESLGFCNIQVENLQDVVLGVFTKEGTIEKVTINGSENFKTGDWIDKDAKILITYHGK